MQILTLDDRPELADIGGYFDHENEHVILTKKEDKPRLLYDVANEVKKKAPGQESDEKCVIFLNLFLECKDDGFNWQQDQAGIALLKFLRMMEVHHHVVLVSPYSLEHLIKQDAGNYIVSSEGVSLIEPKFDCLYDFSEFEGYYDIQSHRQEQDANTEDRLGFANRFAKYLYEWMIKYGWIQEKQQNSTKTAEEKQPVSLHELADDTFDANDLTDYLKNGFELPADERHNWANWWGIIQLCDVHRSAFPNELNFGSSKSYPGNIDESLKSLRNFQLRKIYQTDENFQEALASERRSDMSKYLDLYREEIESQDEQIQDLKSSIEAAISEEAKNNLKENLKKAASDLEETKKERNSIEEDLTKLNRVIDSDDEDVSIQYLNEFRYVESESKPKILYIDDQAHEGWSDIFQIMLYGKKDQPENVFKPIHDINDDIQSFYIKAIKPEIENNNGPDLILLDLRLLNEGGTLQDVYEISGARLLKHIREDYPGQPVMMTTASNKAWTIRELSKLGIDCYWIKEGIDVSQSLSQEGRKKYSANNYLSFLKYVKTLSGKDYQLLKEVETLLKKILRNNYWWKNPNWMHSLGGNAPELYPVQIQTDPDIVIKNLTNILFLMRQYFYLFHFQQGHLRSSSSWFYPSLIIQHIGKIIEVIHSFESLINRGEIRKGDNFHPNIKTVMGPREDELGITIYKKRNNASHQNNAKYLTKDDIHEMINLVYRYLLNTPSCVLQN